MIMQKKKSAGECHFTSDILQFSAGESSRGGMVTEYIRAGI